MSKSRDYCFTTNNYTQGHIDQLSTIDCTYVVYGKEVGDSGTPHLQGYIRFKSQRNVTAIIKLMSGSHIAIKKGTCQQAIDYCKKDGDIYERGEPPASQEEKGDRGKNAMKEIIKRAREGDESWLEEEHPAEYYHHLATFRSHKKAKTQVMGYKDTDTPHEWWVGPTGTGKSKKLWEEFPDHYRKEQNKWWCNYNGQDIVAIEEASPKTMEHLASRLKQWADRYPYSGEIKGGRLEGIRPAKIIVLSNYTIDQCFPNPEDHEPLHRRFNVIQFGTSTPSPWHNSYNKPK